MSPASSTFNSESSSPANLTVSTTPEAIRTEAPTVSRDEGGQKEFHDDMNRPVFLNSEVGKESKGDTEEPTQRKSYLQSMRDRYNSTVSTINNTASTIRSAYRTTASNGIDAWDEIVSGFTKPVFPMVPTILGAAALSYGSGLYGYSLAEEVYPMWKMRDTARYAKSVVDAQVAAVGAASRNCQSEASHTNQGSKYSWSSLLQ